MKNSKRKTNMKSSILILLLLAILLIVSTYAWFTANRTVKVSDLEVNVETQNGLQISADAVNWGATLKTADLTGVTYTGAANQLPANIGAVSTVGDVDANGHLVLFNGSVNANDDGKLALTSSLETDGTGVTTTGNYMAFDIYLKVQQASTIYLTPNSSVVETAENKKGIDNAARVAFITEGNTTDSDTAANMQALKTTDKANAFIWEPNANTHSTTGIANALSAYEKEITADQAAIAYDGVKAAITTPIELLKTNATDTAASFAPVTTVTSTKGQSTTIKEISLAAGVTKIRVYMWIEGQDVDCENSASGADLALNLNLSMDE